MKVALVQPPIRRQVWAGVPDVVNQKDSHLFPSLAVMYLSAYVKSKTDHACEVVDFRLDEPDHEGMAARFRALRPDVVAVTANSHNLVNVADVIRAARAARPDVFIVLGGPHANAFPELAARLRGPDIAVRGDGEEALAGILRALSAGRDPIEAPGTMRARDGAVEFGPDPRPIDDLDSLPFPDRDGAPPRTYFTPGMREANATTMLSSRGCPFKCIFCSVPHRFRARSPRNVAAEMDECARRHGIREVHFVDDLFNITEKRVAEISEEILRLGVKMAWGFKGSPAALSDETLRLARRAGCVRAHLGVETYTEEGLKALGKTASLDQIKEAFRMTRRAGIRSIAYMIIGSPHEKTVEEVAGCADFIGKLRPDYVVYSLFSPYPETESFRMGAERGLWPADVWEKFMLDPTPDHRLPTKWTEHLSEDQLVAVFKKVNYRFYAHPRTVLRTFLAIRTLTELRRILSGGFSLLRLWFLPTRKGAI